MIDTGTDKQGEDNGISQDNTPPAGEDAPFATDAGFEKPAQLDLGEDDVRLPWLEGDDEEEEVRSGLGQSALLVVLGVLAIALILGSVLWLTRKKPETLVADGGTIAAPKEPYKVKPENPGGEVVAGTGDTSFAVAEGQRRQTKIGGDEQPATDATKNVKVAANPASEAGEPAAKPSVAAPAPVKGVGVQVGAYASKEAAEAGWTTLKSQYSALSGVSHRVVQGQADIGTVYRLQAVPGDAAAARSLCAGMKSAGLSCQVKN